MKRIISAIGEFLWFTIAFIAIIATLLSIPYILSGCHTKDTTIKHIESASLDGQISGSFGLFGGTTNEQQYYMYYVKHGEGLLLEKTWADRTIIVETSGRTPQVHIQDCGMNKIYVPEDTVILDYNVAQPGL